MKVVTCVLLLSVSSSGVAVPISAVLVRLLSSVAEVDTMPVTAIVNGSPFAITK